MINFRRQARKYISRRSEPNCLLLMDAFNEYYFPQTALDALSVLNKAGCKVGILSTIGAGRTLISKGFLTQTLKHAQTLLDEISRIDPDGNLPIIGLEPSEIYTLRDEFMDLFPGGRQVAALAERAFMIDEFLLRPGADGLARYKKISPIKGTAEKRTNVLIHGHCYQKAQPPAVDGYPSGVAATSGLLESFGYSVSIIDDGCCGMAGAFGYEAEHYALSKQVGELTLIPAIMNNPESIIVAAGISCQAQIEDGTGRRAVHPISLVANCCV